MKLNATQRWVMSIAIRITDSLVHEAKKAAHFNKRSLTKQIEYWAQLGRVIEDNKDLPFDFIKDILISLEEEKQAGFEPYVFKS